MKNTIAKTSLVMLIAVMAGTQLYAQKEADKLKAEIKALDDKLVKAAMEDNEEVWASFYSDNVIYMPNYGPMIKGKKLMIEHGKKEKEMGYKMISMNLNPYEVYPDKKHVIEVGHYVVRMQIPGMDEPVDDNGKYVTVWEKQKDGSLKILVDTWNTDLNPMEMGNTMMPKEK